jgi:hypothetical protein
MTIHFCPASGFSNTINRPAQESSGDDLEQDRLFRAYTIALELAENTRSRNDADIALAAWEEYRREVAPDEKQRAAIPRVPVRLRHLL